MVSGSGRPKSPGVQNSTHKRAAFKSKPGKPGGKAVNKITSTGYSILGKFRDAAAALPSTKSFINPASNVMAGFLKTTRDVQSIKQGVGAIARRIPRRIGGRAVGQLSNAMIRNILPNNLVGRYVGSRYLQPLAQKGLHKLTSAMFKRNGPKTTAKFYKAMTGAGTLKQFGDMLQGVVAMGLQVTIPRISFSENRPGVGKVIYPKNHLAESVWLMDPIYKPDESTAALWEIRVGGASATSTTADKAPYAMVVNFGGLMFNPKNPNKPKALPPSYFAERSLQFAANYAKIGVKGLAKFYLSEDDRKKAKAAGKKLDVKKIQSEVKLELEGRNNRLGALRYMWMTSDGEVWEKQLAKKTKKGRPKKRSQDNLNYKGGKNPYYSNPNWKNVQGADAESFVFNYLGATGSKVQDWMKAGLDMDAIEYGAQQTMLIMQGKRKAKVKENVFNEKTKRYQKGPVIEVPASLLTGFEGMVPIYAPVKTLKGQGRGKARKYTSESNRYKETVLMPPTAEINKKYTMTVGSVDLSPKSNILFEVSDGKGGTKKLLNAKKTIELAEKKGAIKIIKHQKTGKVELVVEDFDKFVEIFGVQVVNPAGAASVSETVTGKKVVGAKQSRKAKGAQAAQTIRDNPNFQPILKTQQTKIMNEIADELNLKFSKGVGPSKVATGEQKTIKYKRKVKGRKNRKTVEYKKPVYETRHVAYDPLTGTFKLPILTQELKNIEEAIDGLEKGIAAAKSRKRSLETGGISKSEALDKLESRGILTGEKFLAEVKRVEGKKSYDEFIKSVDGTLLKQDAGNYFVTGVNIGKGGVSYEKVTPFLDDITRDTIRGYGTASKAEFADEIKELSNYIKDTGKELTQLKNYKKSIEGRVATRTKALQSQGIDSGTSAFNYGTANYFLAERKAIEIASKGMKGYSGPQLRQIGLNSLGENRFSALGSFKTLGGADTANIITRNMPTTAQSYLAHNFSGPGLTNPMTQLVGTPSKQLNEVVFTFKKGTKARDQADKLGIFNYEMNLRRTSATGAPGAIFKKVKPQVERSGNNITLAFRDPEMPTRAIYLYQNVGRKGQVKSTPEVRFGHQGATGRTKEIFKHTTTSGRRNVFETSQGAGDGIVRYTQQFMSGVANAGKVDAQNMITKAVMARALFNKEEGEVVKRITTERAGVYSITDDGLGPNLSTRGYIIRFEER